jgi:hypothetical protein
VDAPVEHLTQLHSARFVDNNIFIIFPFYTFSQFKIPALVVTNRSWQYAQVAFSFTQRHLNILQLFEHSPVIDPELLLIKELDLLIYKRKGSDGHSNLGI